MTWILKNKSFRNLLSAQFFSAVGNWVSRMGILTLVYSINKSTVDMSIIAIVMMLPYIFLGPYAGTIVDRKNKKHILMLSDLFRAILVISIPFLEKYVFEIVFIYTIVSVVSRPAEQSLLPKIISKDQFKVANSISSSLNSFMMILGPSIGGIIIAIMGVKYCFYFDSITFLISLFFVSLIPYAHDKVISKKNQKSFSVSNGLSYIKNNKVIKNTLIINSLIGLAAGVSNALLIIYAFKYIGTDTQGYGLILSAKGAMVLITSLLIAKFSSKWSTKMLFKIGLIGLGLACIAFPLNTLLTLALTIQGINGMFNACYAIARTTIIQENTDEAYLGRVFSINSMFVNIFSIASLGIVGILGDEFNVRLALIISGIIILIAGLLSLSFFVKKENSSINESVESTSQGVS